MDQACVGNPACRWAYLLGWEALSLQRAQQKVMRRQLWSGFISQDDISFSDGSDGEGESSGNDGFQVCILSPQISAPKRG